MERQARSIKNETGNYSKSMSGKITFKEWVIAEADRIGIKYHALQMRLHRGKHEYPKTLVRGKVRARHVVIKMERAK